MRSTVNSSWVPIMRLKLLTSAIMMAESFRRRRDEPALGGGSESVATANTNSAPPLEVKRYGSFTAPRFGAQSCQDGHDPEEARDSGWWRPRAGHQQRDQRGDHPREPRRHRRHRHHRRLQVADAR